MKISLNISALRLRESLPIIAAFVFLQFSTPIFAAETSAAAEQELEAVREAIESIQSWLAVAENTQSDEINKLQQADLEISNLSQSVTAIETTIVTTGAEIEQLSQQSDKLAQLKQEQSALLQQAIRTAYMAGNQSAIELLLNQEDISKSARLLHYHRLFTEAQLNSMTSFQKTLDELQQVDQLLKLKAADLASEQLQLRTTLQGLNDSKQQRELALAQLRADINSRSSQLEQLEIDQAQLTDLIIEINRAIADVPAAMQASPFNLQQGKLQLPVAGEIVNRFGSRLGASDLRRQGVTISVSEGTPVQAIHPGRIVFSDWLRGTGLLVIVDHGEGYMSLYGANQALSKQAGDWVNTGDILATSGSASDLTGNRSSAQSRPGLYFEIRHRGEAQNPSLWFAQ